MKRKILFIVNRFSGANSKNNLDEIIQENLDCNKYDYKIRYTEFAGHAKQLGSEAKDEEYDIVASVGGDGTINEIAQSLVNSNCNLLVVPGGSGNGLAMHLGMGRNIGKCIANIESYKTHKIDSCRVNEDFFINVAGVGFDAIVAHRIKEQKRRGILMYIREFFKGLKDLKAIPMRISIDDKVIEGKFINVVAANASMYGYGFSIAPLADLEDGLFDLIMIKEAPKWKYFIHAYRFLTRSLHKAPFVDLIKTRNLNVELLEDVTYFQIDGEERLAERILNFNINQMSLSILTNIKA